jgi:cytochrome c oxidase subunit IV
MAGHVETLKNYLIIFTILMVLLIVTIVAAAFDLDHIFGGLNLLVAMTIAIVKAILVVMFFMHLRYCSKLTWVFAFGAFVWLGIMLTLTSTDYAARAETDGSVLVPPTPPQRASLAHPAVGQPAYGADVVINKSKEE